MTWCIILRLARIITTSRLNITTERENQLKSSDALETQKTKCHVSEQTWNLFI